jgi:outer membrane lipoprotein SlyB
MGRSGKVLIAMVLSLFISSVTLGGTITGSRANRTGTITGSRVGTITGSKTGTITGSRRGTITGSGLSRSQSTNESTQNDDEWLSRVVTFVFNLYF